MDIRQLGLYIVEVSEEAALLLLLLLLMMMIIHRHHFALRNGIAKL